MIKDLLNLIESALLYLPWIAGSLSLIFVLIGLISSIITRRRLYREMNKEFHEMEDRVNTNLRES